MASQPLRQLITVLHGCIKGGNYARALRLLITNLPRTRGDYRLRRYVADTLLALDRKREAAEIYEILVRHFTHAGEPLLAVIVARRLAEIEPSIGAHLDHIASLYAASSPFLNEAATSAVAAREVEAALDLSGTEPDMPLDSLVAIAHELALRKDGFASSPDEVPPIPLLSLLSVELLRTVLEQLQPRAFNDDHPLLTPGEPPAETLWTVSGRLRATLPDGRAARVEHQVLLGHGLLFNARPLPAHVALYTTGPVEALALSREAITTLRAERKLLAAAAQLDLAARVDAAVDACGLFNTVPTQERDRILQTFKPCLIPPDTVLIAEGAPSRGIWIVVAGKLEVNKRTDDVEMTVGTLGPGQIAGEISLITESDAVATVVADGPARLLFAARDDFFAFCQPYPEILDRLREDAAQRLLG